MSDTTLYFRYTAKELFSNKEFLKLMIGIPFKDDKGNVIGEVIEVTFDNKNSVEFIVKTSKKCKGWVS